MKATVLIDNNGTEKLRGEWGLSVYIEYEGKNILLDSGATELFAENAEKLGLSLENVDYAVISHAHYDHSGGTARFCAINKTAPIYIKSESEENCFFKKWFIRRYIGLPKNILSDCSDRFVKIDDIFKICDGVYIVPHKTAQLSEIGKRENMYLKKSSEWILDDFSHEQSLVFETEKGLVIFNSCCHGGTANIIREVGEAFSDKKVYGLIGGFHLYNKTAGEVRTVAAQIRQTGIEYVCTGHCTKKKALAILKDELGDIVHSLEVGMVMEF